jgi:hypothetical protein
MEKIEENKEIDKSLRVRVANIMQYEEYLSEEKIKSVLTSYKAIEKWAYIKHDKDKNSVVPQWQVDDLRNCDNAINPEENKELKKPHFHIVLKFKTNISINSIAKWFGIKPNYIKAPKGTNAFIQCVQYLTHESDSQQKLGKYLYPDEEVFSNFNFREELDLYKSKGLLKGGKNKKLELREQVLKNGLKLSEILSSDYVNDMSSLQLCRKEYLRNFAIMPPTRINYYIQGGSGAGKSFSSRALAKTLVDPLNQMKEEEIFFITGQGNAMFQGYDGQPVIIFDDVRSWDLLNYYNKSAGAIFNLFDIIPSKSEQNIKFGSIKLVNLYSIVNGMQPFEEFVEDICYRAKESGFPDPDKQLYRRFLGRFNVKKHNYDFFVNQQFFDPNEENYKLYKAYENMGIKCGLLTASKQWGETEKFIELRNKHFEVPAKKAKEAIEFTTKKDKTDEELQQEFDLMMLDSEIIEPTLFDASVEVSQEEDLKAQIETLQNKLREINKTKFKKW